MDGGKNGVLELLMGGELLSRVYSNYFPIILTSVNLVSLYNPSSMTHHRALGFTLT